MLRVALAGNPNTGKTSLFNALTGARAKVGNYPGVTVERREGRLRTPDGLEVELIDLPGCYSLTARSREEEIAHDVLIGVAGDPPVDLVVLVADATSLARNLYLALQLAEFERPLVIAINMMDVAEREGLEIDVDGLAAAIGVPVVPVIARTGRGVPELVRSIAETAESRAATGTKLELHATDQVRVESVRQELGDSTLGEALWVLVSNERHLARYPSLQEPLVRARAELAEPLDADRPLDFNRRVILARFARLDDVVRGHIQPRPRTRASASERADRVLTHPVWGMGLFVVAMIVLFQAVFTWSDPMIGGVEDAMTAVAGLVGDAMGPGVLRELVVDGLIAGVGNILVFLPQILLLFLAVAIMEESGYMARASLLLDRVMQRVGLHGKAFVPLLSSFACAIPGIMAARTVETARDRLITIMVAPLMSCSARLPVYTLVIAAVFSDAEPVFGVLSAGGLLVTAMYFLGVLAALGTAWLFKKTLLRGPTPPLILELPDYKRPLVSAVALQLWRRARVFVVQTGSIILALSVILWAAMSYPRTSDDPQERLQNSVAGHVGHAIEPLIEPLGFDWKIGIGLVGSFAAREVLVSTLGQVYGAGSDVDEGSVVLRDALLAERDPATGRSKFTPLVGLSLMVFFVLAMQCLSTVATVRRETGTWRWPLLMIVYMNALAWVASFATFQIGSALGFS